MRQLRLVVAAGVLLGVALLVGLRLAGRESGRGARGARPEPPEVAADATLAELRRSERAPIHAADSSAGTAREARADDVPLGAVRGRLVEAGTGAYVRAERVVLLASPFNRVAESVRTRADGSFDTERRFPRGKVRAWVKDPETLALIVRHEAEFDPTSPDEWLVPVPRRSGPPGDTGAGGVTLHGRVRDLEGIAVAGAQVKLFPVGARGKVSCRVTDDMGEFELDELATGPHRLLVQGRFTSSERLELVLVEGYNEAGEILLPSLAAAGFLRGSLVVEEGIGEGVEEREDPFGVVLVRELASGKLLAATTDWSLFSGEEDGIATFAIEDLPDGEYELSVVPIDGREYEPSLLRVSPPAAGLEFRARTTAGRFFCFRVRQAARDEELADAFVLGRYHGQWFGGKDPDLFGGCDRWVVYAEGFRPARGDFWRRTRRAPEADKDGFACFEVDVALEPGYGLAVLCKDVESDRLLAPEFDDYFGPGLEGVAVLADGGRVASSDEDGLALLDLARAPERIDFVRPGWRVVGEREMEGVLLVHLARE